MASELLLFGLVMLFSIIATDFSLEWSDGG